MNKKSESTSLKALVTIFSSIVLVIGSILSLIVWLFAHEEEQDISIQSLTDDRLTTKERLETESRMKGLEKDIEYLQKWHERDE